MNRLTCCLLAMFASVGLVSARSHYATAYNQFRSLTAVLSSQPKAHVSCALDGNCLDLRNASAIPLVATDTTLTANTGYSYLVRASSHSSQAGRSYTVTDADGNKSRVEGTSWGIVFDYTDSAHYHRAEVSCSNSNLYDDLTDQRTMHVSIYRHDGSGETLLSRRTLSDGVDMEDGLNTLMVSVANGQADISVGKKRLQPVATVALDDVDSKTVKTGLYLSPGAHIAIERTVLSTESNPPRRVATCWTREALDQHLAMSSDPIEGYWQYQDRDMEDQSDFQAQMIDRINKIIAERQPKPDPNPQPGKPGPKPTPKQTKVITLDTAIPEPLKSEQDVDTYLAMLKQQLMSHINNNEEIIIN